MAGGLERWEGLDDVWKVNSEIKEGISLSAAESVVFVLRDEIVYRSSRSAGARRVSTSRLGINVVVYVYIPGSLRSRETLIMAEKSSEAEDHLRVLELLSDPDAVRVWEDSMLMVPTLVLLSPPAEGMLFRAFPAPPRPVIIVWYACQNTCGVHWTRKACLAGAGHNLSTVNFVVQPRHCEDLIG